MSVKEEFEDVNPNTNFNVFLVVIIISAIALSVGFYELGVQTQHYKIVNYMDDNQEQMCKELCTNQTFMFSIKQNFDKFIEGDTNE